MQEKVVSEHAELLVESKMINLRGQMVILDKDVALLYQVKTKHVNQAVRNNPEKFPVGYVFELNDAEMEQVKNYDQIPPNSHYAAKAFTEKGLYMLATILKGAEATSTTIRIIETYAKMKEAGRNLRQMINEDKEEEYTIEINLMAFKLSRTVKKSKK